MARAVVAIAFSVAVVVRTISVAVVVRLGQWWL